VRIRPKIVADYIAYEKGEWWIQGRGSLQI
jgi:hypothetical protein